MCAVSEDRPEAPGARRRITCRDPHRRRTVDAGEDSRAGIASPIDRVVVGDPIGRRRAAVDCQHLRYRGRKRVEGEVQRRDLGVAGDIRVAGYHHGMRAVCEDVRQAPRAIGQGWNHQGRGGIDNDRYLREYVARSG